MESSRWCVAWLLLAALTMYGADACSCMRAHPQVHFCSADFVIVATVRRMMSYPLKFENVYKLKIRNEIKMSDKAKVALKAGRLVTADNDGLCGQYLEVNTTYLITGKIVSLEARVNLCNYVQPWKSVTNRQRKGFRKLYKQGCPCRIQPTYGRGRQTSKHVCEWDRHNNCHNDYGVCLINKDGQCDWARAPLLTQCLQKRNPLTAYRHRQLI